MFELALISKLATSGPLERILRVGRLTALASALATGSTGCGVVFMPSLLLALITIV